MVNEYQEAEAVIRARDKSHSPAPDGDLDGSVREGVARGADEDEVAATAGTRHLPGEDTRHPGIFVNIFLYCRKKSPLGMHAGRHVGRLLGWHTGRLLGMHAGRLPGMHAGRLLGWLS